MEFLKEWWFIISPIGIGIMIGLKYFFSQMIFKPIKENKDAIEHQNRNYNKKFDETHEKLDGITKETANNAGKLDAIIELIKK